MKSNKILQLFFTTIPIAIGTTWHGTGLGLSLASDIVKAHGGELSSGLPSEKAETKPARAGTDGETKARRDGLVGRGISYIIQLPAKEN